MKKSTKKKLQRLLVEALKEEKDIQEQELREKEIEEEQIKKLKSAKTGVPITIDKAYGIIIDGKDKRRIRNKTDYYRGVIKQEKTYLKIIIV